MSSLRIPTVIALLLAATFTTPATAGVNRWTTGGPYGGDVHAFAVASFDPMTMYAGMEEGVFKSTDGGATWAIGDEGSTDDYVHALIIDPAVPMTLWAAARGPLGLIRSTDGGVTWSAANDGLTGLKVRDLAIGPAPETFFAGTDLGIFRSADGGASWILSNPLDGFVAVELAMPATVYAASSFSTVLKSTDGGVSWVDVSRRGTGFRSGILTDLVVDPQTPDTVYVAALGGGACNCGLNKSTDGGASWELVSEFRADVLAIDPAEPTTLYAGTVVGVWKSTDGGANWSSVLATDSAVEALAIDPTTPATLYAGTRADGVFKSTDGGAGWSAFNRGLGDLAVLSLGIEASRPTTLYAGPAGRGVFRSIDGGESWFRVPGGLERSEVFALAADPQAPSSL